MAIRVQESFTLTVDIGGLPCKFSGQLAKETIVRRFTVTVESGDTKQRNEWQRMVKRLELNCTTADCCGIVGRSRRNRQAFATTSYSVQGSDESIKVLEELYRSYLLGNDRIIIVGLTYGEISVPYMGSGQGEPKPRKHNNTDFCPHDTAQKIGRDHFGDSPEPLSFSYLRGKQLPPTGRANPPEYPRYTPRPLTVELLAEMATSI